MAHHHPLLFIVVDTTTVATGLPSTQTLWIIIACVSAITVIAIAALVAVLCRRKLLYDRKKPANLKSSNQAPRGMSKACKQHPSGLWINHEQVRITHYLYEVSSSAISSSFIFQVELKAMEKADGLTEANEMTAMLHSRSQFDVASASMLGEEEVPRYSTLGRSRPVIIAPHPHREGILAN